MINIKNDYLLKTLNTSKYSFITKGWYFSYYHPVHSSGHDSTSRKLLWFKNGNDSITTKWIDIVLANFNVGVNFDIIIRVLGSSETTNNSNTSVDKLGVKLSSKLGVPYGKDNLYKTRTTRQLKGLGKEGRQNEISGVYRFKPPYGRTIRNVLLIDDVITTGTTIKEIKRAITAEIGSFNLYMLVLGKTYDSWADDEGSNSLMDNLLDYYEPNPPQRTTPVIKEPVKQIEHPQYTHESKSHSKPRKKLSPEEVDKGCSQMMYAAVAGAIFMPLFSLLTYGWGWNVLGSIIAGGVCGAYLYSLLTGLYKNW